MNLKLRAGVLILGSLLWDNADRENWRRRLDMTAATRVRLPIRYGRRSGSRSCTHTMVLSKLCYRHRELGVGYVTPCRTLIGSADDLLQETHALAAAEGLSRWTWGAVGVLTNPDSKVATEILAVWKRHATGQLAQCRLFTHHPKSERPVLCQDGILRMRWPRLADTGAPADFDLLLATPTALNSAGSYPTVKEIGETFATQDYPTYFVENVRHGVRTAQDAAIWKTALRLKPEWAVKYEDVTTALGAQVNHARLEYDANSHA
jgi:hypothetical protein